MKKVFYCSCGEYLSGIDFDDSERAEDMAWSVIEATKFACNCGKEYQIGLFEYSNVHVPILAKDDQEEVENESNWKRIEELEQQLGGYSL